MLKSYLFILKVKDMVINSYENIFICLVLDCFGFSLLINECFFILYLYGWFEFFICFLLGIFDFNLLKFIVVLFFVEFIFCMNKVSWIGEMIVSWSK